MIKINTRKKLFLTAVLILCVALIAGLSAVEAQDAPEEIPIEKMETPTELGELINLFDRLEYSIITHHEGEKVQDSLIEYEYQGEEMLEGAETDILDFTMTGEQAAFSSLKIWFDGEEIVQLEVDGDIIPSEMAGMMKDTMVRSIMFPFYNFSDLAMEQLGEAGDVSRSQETVLDRELEIITVEVEDMPEYDIESSEARLAEFEDFVMAISYEYSSLEEDLNLAFEIEGLEFR